MSKAVKITDKFQKVNESYTITNCDNGYMVEMSGQDTEDNWINVKYIVSSIDDLKQMVCDLAWMPRT